MNALSHSARRASALVITLAILTLVSILVVGLSETMRVERASANTHLERERAVNFAQLGVDRVVALLKTNTGDVQKSWISAPGLIVCSTGTDVSTSGTDFKLTKEVDLYSGVSAYSTGSAGWPACCIPPNLNMVMMSDTTGTVHHLITNRPADPDSANTNVVDLPLKWIYVRSDGSWDTAEQPPLLSLTNRAKPIIGRFAYWADDESSKVNYNTAWNRPLPTNNPPPQCAVNLLALNYLTASGTAAVTAKMVKVLQQAKTPATTAYYSVNRFFNSPQDGRSLETAAAGISSMFESNKFSLTHYNHDPNTTFFNEPRIILTTQAQYALSGSARFLDILTKPNFDPGLLGSIDNNKLATTVAMLITYLQRSDWPMISGSASMQDKYFASNHDRLAQLALNIIDYVRCRESKEPVVEPLRGIMTSGSFSSMSDQSNSGFMGMTRTPRINELGVWLSDDMNTAKVFVELYLPKRYGLDSLDLSKYGLGVDIDGYSAYTSGTNSPTNLESNILPGECDGGVSKINAGGYKVITRTIDMSKVHIYTTRPASVAVRIDFAQPNLGNRLDIAPQVAWEQVSGTNTALVESYKLYVPIAAPGTAPASIQSKEVDDPRVNRDQADWKLCSSGNTFGGQNSCYSPKIKKADPNITPQQDTDSNGYISDASLYMPYPRNPSDSSSGFVTSPAELGTIHTGVQGSGTSGIPWRTIRLQPSKDDTTVVPDWAFMDLFAAPTTALAQIIQNNIQAIFNPHGTAVGGRVSVNAQAQPFGNPNYSACAIPLERVDPLVAALDGGVNASGTTISLDTAKTIARAIYDHQLANGGKSFSAVNLPGSKAQFYTSPGEIVEIKGVADSGEESETNLSFASNLIITRGNVFSIYTIGQALKQTPSGGLVVTGEQRLQSMVERYQDSSTGPVKFRSVFFRNLTP